MVCICIYGGLVPFCKVWRELGLGYTRTVDPTFSVSRALTENSRSATAPLVCGISRYHRVQILAKILIGRDSNPCSKKMAIQRPYSDAALTASVLPYYVMETS